MKPAQHVANPGLAALIRGAGYPSLERFAVAVNVCGWEMYGIRTSYDHVTVKRWLAGGRCQHPEVVAAVLTNAWGVDVPVAVIWPELRDGQKPIPAHLQPWVAARTLEELGVFLRSDMLSRRETLSGAVKAATGPALLAPIARWLGVPAGRLLPRDDGTRRIGVDDVAAIEESTHLFAVSDAERGGALSREAAVGQLKYAVDLAEHASYGDAVGNRLLAAIARLSGLVGYLCQDCGMSGPAMRYFTFGLQAARESTDERAPLLVVSILADMAQAMRWLGRPNTALRLHDLAVGQLPADRRRYTVVRAVLASKRAEDGLCYLSAPALPEMQNALNLAFELYSHASHEDHRTAITGWHRALDMSEAGTQGRAAAAYLVMAKDNKHLAVKAEESTLQTLANAPAGQGRDRVLSQIRLARIRFAMAEPEQACDDGLVALDMNGHAVSAMIRKRLRELLADSEPYTAVPRVAEMRRRVEAAVGQQGYCKV
jgi:hypothetical protein